MSARSLNKPLVSETPINRGQLLRVLRSRIVYDYFLELKVMLKEVQYVG